MERLLPTPRGAARAHIALPPSPPRALVVLGHGAGGGVAAPDLVAVRDAAVAAGYGVVLLEQPYRVQGKRAAPAAPVLDEAWVSAVGQLSLPGVRLVVGGRSSGARVACRTAGMLGAAGVVALAFPTHPPQSPARDRLPELALPAVPVLVVQGDRDPFGIPPRRRGRSVRIIEGADHSLRKSVKTTAGIVVRWLNSKV
jgi:predicted alpha/beta-hydrolase family hydrolase